MKVLFPTGKSVLHKVPENKNVIPVFTCGGRVISQRDADDVFVQVQMYNRLLDVESYAENGYGPCNDPKVAQKVKHFANEIRKPYMDRLEWEDGWFRTLENTIEDFLEE